LLIGVVERVFGYQIAIAALDVDILLINLDGVALLNNSVFNIKGSLLIQHFVLSLLPSPTFFFSQGDGWTFTS